MEYPLTKEPNTGAPWTCILRPIEILVRKATPIDISAEEIIEGGSQWLCNNDYFFL